MRVCNPEADLLRDLAALDRERTCSEPARATAPRRAPRADAGMTRSGMEIRQYQANGKLTTRKIMATNPDAKKGEMSTLFTRDTLNAMLYEHVAAEFSDQVTVRGATRIALPITCGLRCATGAAVMPGVHIVVVHVTLELRACAKSAGARGDNCGTHTRPSTGLPGVCTG